MACVHIDSQHQDPIWPRPVQGLCWLQQSPSGPAVFRLCFLGDLYAFWFLESFHLRFHRIPLVMKGRNGGRPGVPVSLILYSLSSGESLCLFPSTAEGSFSDCDWSRCWFMSMSSGVIWMLCSFSIMVLFGFPLDPWPIYSQFFATWSSIFKSYYIFSKVLSVFEIYFAFLPIALVLSLDS